MGVQKKKLLHRIMALAIAVAVGLSVIVPGGTSAEAATIPADVTKPSANCVFIAMKGKYVSEASAAGRGSIRSVMKHVSRALRLMDGN